MISMPEDDEDENGLAISSINDTGLVHSSFYLAPGPAAPTNQVQVPLTNQVKVSVPVPSLDLETNRLIFARAMRPCRGRFRPW